MTDECGLSGPENELSYKNKKSTTDLLLYNDQESYKIMKKPKQKNNVDNLGKLSDDPPILRKGSIILYKNREQKKKFKAAIMKCQKEHLNKQASTKKIRKNTLSKKVRFLPENFVTIIDVESFKKFNAENTSKDPYEDAAETKVSFNCTCFIF